MFSKPSILALKFEYCLYTTVYYNVLYTAECSGATDHSVAEGETLYSEHQLCGEHSFHGNGHGAERATDVDQPALGAAGGETETSDSTDEV